MGFFFRKSAKFGPLRLNFSKSGVGASLGVKGFRITSTAKGTTYYTLGTKGFYYRETIGNIGANGQAAPGPSGVEDPGSSFTTADASRFVDSSTANLVEDLSRRARLINPIAILSVFFILWFLGVFGDFVPWVTWFLVLTGISAGVYLHFWHVERRTTVLTYELDANDLNAHRSLNDAVSYLKASQFIWRITSEADTWDQRRNAGATKLLTRSSVTVGKLRIPYVKTNVEVWGVKMSDCQLYFLPDILLYRQGRRFGAIQYADVEVSAGSTRYIESDVRPKDSVQVGTTWRFARVDGGPDRRFNNNYPIPIYQYGTVTMTSIQGLHLRFHSSSLQNSHSFVRKFAQLRVDAATSDQNPSGADDPKARTWETADRSPGEIRYAAAAQLLELGPSPTLDEITSNYRRLARMYHPDRVAELGREFQVLAEQKMRELNAAYALLKKAMETQQ